MLIYIYEEEPRGLANEVPQYEKDIIRLLGLSQGGICMSQDRE